MTSHDLIKQLEASGWQQVRMSGSHRILKKPGVKELISVPDHGKQDIKPGLLNRILKQAGLK